MNNLYDAIGDNEVDDKVALLFEANETNLVAVKTPVGETERINIERIIQQGGIWGPIQCSNSIDQIGKQCDVEKPEYCYYYRGKIKILPLAMVDDLMCVSKCGLESIILNSYINTKIEIKRCMFLLRKRNPSVRECTLENKIATVLSLGFITLI